MDDSEISILDSIRFFEKNLDFELRAIFTDISRLVYLAQSVAAATINVASRVTLTISRPGRLSQRLVAAG